MRRDSGVSMKSSPSEKISCTRPTINRMTYYRELCNLGLTKKCASRAVENRYVAGRGLDPTAHQKHDDEFYISIRLKLTDFRSKIKLGRRREPRKNPEAAHRSPLTALIDLRLAQRNEGEGSNDQSIRITVDNERVEEIF